ncbi:MAG TPA: hypothetical protein VM120_28765 [Bryobacteraceae bacterium]|nr:hypothetical protein [Bryobacteraceae bacterium]
MIPLTKPAKSHYSEDEAALVLGVSVDDLRALIRNHIAKGEEEMANVASATYQPSDLLVLRMILGGFKTNTMDNAIT